MEDRVEIEELMARYCWSLDTAISKATRPALRRMAGCPMAAGPMRRPRRAEACDRFAVVRPAEPLSRPPAPLSAVLMSPEGERGVRIKAFWSILQHDVETHENRVFGMGTWDTLAIRETDGE